MTLELDRATDIARMFRALGDPTRVRILDFLCERCSPIAVGEEGEVRPILGPSFGEVCCHITGREKISSTISFHLNALWDAGLISVEKRGRYMVCNVNRDAVQRLAAYLQSHGSTGDDSCEEGCL
jgi:DNA-binding transcriptional ArsR family regulator